MPKDTEPLSELSMQSVQKSSSIYSENYDAEADIMQSMNFDSNNSDMNGKFLGFVNKLFGQNEN